MRVGWVKNDEQPTQNSGSGVSLVTTPSRQRSTPETPNPTWTGQMYGAGGHGTGVEANQIAGPENTTSVALGPMSDGRV